MGGGGVKKNPKKSDVFYGRPHRLCMQALQFRQKTIFGSKEPLVQKKSQGATKSVQMLREVEEYSDKI